MSLSYKVSAFTDMAGKILSANPFYGIRCPGAPLGHKLRIFDRPIEGGRHLTDDEIRQYYEVKGEALVRRS